MPPELPIGMPPSFPTVGAVGTTPLGDPACETLLDPSWVTLFGGTTHGCPLMTDNGEPALLTPISEPPCETPLGEPSFGSPLGNPPSGTLVEPPWGSPLRDTALENTLMGHPLGDRLGEPLLVTHLGTYFGVPWDPPHGLTLAMPHGMLTR